MLPNIAREGPLEEKVGCRARNSGGINPDTGSGVIYWRKENTWISSFFVIKKWILSPLFASCSSDLRSWPLLSGCFCTVTLTGNCRENVLYHLNANTERSEEKRRVRERAGVSGELTNTVSLCHCSLSCDWKCNMAVWVKWTHDPVVKLASLWANTI